MDNLNTHRIASLYATFPAHRARELAERLEIHYTPKHGSWLNRVEVNMKRNAVIAIIFLLVSFAFSACVPTAPSDQASEGHNIAENGASTEIPGYHNISTPEFFNNIGKTLSELKNEYPEGEFVASLDGFPDSDAACFGGPGAEYAYFFFGGQSGDFEKAMDECEEQIKCAGFITTANILFPDMEDDMSFEDFFSLISIDDYEYLLGEEMITGEGWLRFTYNGMEVMVNTNEVNADGERYFTGAEIVKRNAPVSIVDPEILHTNQDLAETVMFD